MNNNRYDPYRFIFGAPLHCHNPPAYSWAAVILANNSTHFDWLVEVFENNPIGQFGTINNP